MQTLDECYNSDSRKDADDFKWLLIKDSRALIIMLLAPGICIFLQSSIST